jgi:DNA-binding SARP family transcriptional activator
MSKLSHVTLRLLGGFAIEANVGRPIAISIRSRKARALLAYLALKPDYRARREELATLFWGDNPDALARHSLRQCLILLRQDLCLASEILIVDRETIGLRTQFVSVDARRFMSLARSAAPDELAQAVELWRGAFLPDLALDIEEFDTWHRHEAERLATAAAAVFEALCRNADANGDGERAIAAAEWLVALEPTREDRQRTALMLFARHEGREAALSRAKRLGGADRRTSAPQYSAGQPAVLASLAACRCMRGHRLSRDGHDRRAGGRTEIMVTAERSAAKPSACGSALCRR